MLKKLTIKNVALISEMSIECDDRLNILSGETGAGKSIIVDSLFLLLGAKYDKSLLSHGQDWGLVEGVFEIGEYTRAILDEFLIEYEDEIVVTRKFTVAGKNEIRINGRTATISMLKDVTNTLVDIYGQNQHLTLLEKNQQLRTVEFFEKAKVSKLLDTTGELYNKYKDTKKQLQLLGDESSRHREIETLEFQIAEIEEADIKDGEEERLIGERKILLSGEKIKTALGKVADILCNNDNNVLSLLSECKASLNTIKEIPQYADITKRLEVAKLEIEDIGYTASQEVDNTEGNQKNIENIEKRLEVVRRIKRKYGDEKATLDYLKNAKSRLDILSDADNIGQKLKSQLEKQKLELYKYSVELSDVRKVAAQKLQEMVVKELDELGMNKAQFEVRFADIPDIDGCDRLLSANGFDSVEYYLSTNKGQPIKPLAKVISGGEMSRFMLAIKVIMSQIESIDTLIFDEIDTGISGVIGQAVAKKLAKISRQKQVLCVSHLAQIVAMADKNYLIQKKDNNEKTFTSISPITKTQKINEIARLSGGLSSDIALTAAKELIEWSDNYKNNL